MPSVLSPLTLFLTISLCLGQQLHVGRLPWTRDRKSYSGSVQWPLTPPVCLGPSAPRPDVLQTCFWTWEAGSSREACRHSSVLSPHALYSVLISAFRKTLLSGLEKLLEITLKSMHLWGATVRIMAINHVELVGQEGTSSKNRKTLNLSGFFVSFSTIYITSHHSGKGIWKLQLKHPGYVASLFYAIISKYCCWVRPVILCESVRQHGPL